MSFELVLVLLAAVAAVSGVARRFGFPAPFALVIAGLAVGLVPGTPQFELEPDVVLGESLRVRLAKGELRVSAG